MSADLTPGDSIDVTGSRVLVVDDTPANLDVLVRTLEEAGYDLAVAPGGEVALEIAGEWRPDLILLDVVMPVVDGYEVCRRLQESDTLRTIPVVFITARGETEAVVKAFAVGGVDYVVKPIQVEEVLARVRAHLERARLTRELAQRNQALEGEIARRRRISGERDRLADRLSLISSREAEHWGIEGFVGSSGTVKKVVEEVGLLQSAETIPVLITGESGTGKELIARAIHFGGGRRDRPFIPVNCSAIPADLADSLFFGHARGAFTGADASRVGYFELANDGSLFLDEIGDLPLSLQPKLLRVLEDGVVMPLGANQERREQRMAEGAFREDLYYRLAGYRVSLPPLRSRRDDIPLLATHFLEVFTHEMGIEPPGLHDSALQALTEYDFPGNVRELKNLIERALIHSRGEAIEAVHLQFAAPVSGVSTAGSMDVSRASATAAEGIPLSLEAAERLVVQRTMEQAGGNVAETARRLGASRGRIYRILRGDTD
jgi:DNA-binding NtrC family response regulator